MLAIQEKCISALLISRCTGFVAEIINDLHTCKINPTSELPIVQKNPFIADQLITRISVFAAAA